MEIWKDILETNGEYQISNLGNVKSQRSGKWRILTILYNEQGYKRVDIFVNNKAKTKKIHRLIAIHFIENPNNYKIVNHINGVKDDNRIENLEWCTSSQNNQHAWDNELYIKKYGADNKNACLTWEQAEEIRQMKRDKFRIKQIMSKFGVSESTVCKIISNKKYVRL